MVLFSSEVFEKQTSGHVDTAYLQCVYFVHVVKKKRILFCRDWIC
jgi:hypothetical protein